MEAKITAKSYYGVRHGLETLSQMIWWDEAGAKYGTLRVISSALIEDKPTFGYRGVLIDTGRQFFALEELKRVIDGMAASKLNTFHWHLTDSQSFPFESNVFPEMARWGAFGGDQVYTPDDIRELSDYANVRGIRTLVEIDAPAHAGAGWQWGETKLSTLPETPTKNSQLMSCTNFQERNTAWVNLPSAWTNSRGRLTAESLTAVS